MVKGPTTASLPIFEVQHDSFYFLQAREVFATYWAGFVVMPITAKSASSYILET